MENEFLAVSWEVVQINTEINKTVRFLPNVLQPFIYLYKKYDNYEQYRRKNKNVIQRCNVLPFNKKRL